MAPLLDSFEGVVTFSEPLEAFVTEGMPSTHKVLVTTPEGTSLPIYHMEGIPIGTKLRCDNVTSGVVRITRLS